MRKGSIHGFTKLLQWLIDSDRCGKLMKMNEVKKTKKSVPLIPFSFCPRRRSHNLATTSSVECLPSSLAMNCICRVKVFLLDFSDRIVRIPWRSLKYCLISSIPKWHMIWRNGGWRSLISWSKMLSRVPLWPFLEFKNPWHQGRIGLDKYNYIREAAHGVLARGGSEGNPMKSCFCKGKGCADDGILNIKLSCGCVCHKIVYP